MLFVCHPIVLSFLWELKWSQEKLSHEAIHMQNFGVTNKEHLNIIILCYGYPIFWSGQW